MPLAYVLVIAEADPVARAVGERFGTPPAGEHLLDGSVVRVLAEGVGLLHRPGLHIEDELLAVPGGPGAPPPTLVFPSVHRSARERETLTVHPLGNPSDAAPLGGRPRTLVPTDPRRMTDALRRSVEVAEGIGWPTSFEATHHGPGVAQPAFFVEIGAADYAHPPEAAVAGLARFLPELRPDPGDRIAVGFGGGHYAPHFTELAVERRWAFGHLIPRHAVAEDAREVLVAAIAATPGAEGVLPHRAQDAESGWAGSAPRLREKDAPPRGAAP